MEAPAQPPVGGSNHLGQRGGGSLSPLTPQARFAVGENNRLSPAGSCRWTSPGFPSPDSGTGPAGSPCELRCLASARPHPHDDGCRVHWLVPRLEGVGQTWQREPKTKVWVWWVVSALEEMTWCRLADHQILVVGWCVVDSHQCWKVGWQTIGVPSGDHSLTHLG